MEPVRLVALAQPTPLTSLGARHLAAIAPYASERTVRAGGRLLLDGAFSEQLALVSAGRARVRCAGETVAELEPGDAFGELAPARAAYATATVTAMSDLLLVMFSRHDIRRLREAAPEAAAALLAACAQAPHERPQAPRLRLVHATAA